MGRESALDCCVPTRNILLYGNAGTEILVPDWLITSHVTLITSSDWLFTIRCLAINHLFASSALYLKFKRWKKKLFLRWSTDTYTTGIDRIRKYWSLIG
eukprot:sb/3478663/